MFPLLGGQGISAASLQAPMGAFAAIPQIFGGALSQLAGGQTLGGQSSGAGGQLSAPASQPSSMGAFQAVPQAYAGALSTLAGTPSTGLAQQNTSAAPSSSEFDDKWQQIINMLVHGIGGFGGFGGGVGNNMIGPLSSAAGIYGR